MLNKFDLEHKIPYTEYEADIKHTPLVQYGPAKSFFDSCEDEETIRKIWEKEVHGTKKRIKKRLVGK